MQLYVTCRLSLVSLVIIVPGPAQDYGYAVDVLSRICALYYAACREAPAALDRPTFVSAYTGRDLCVCVRWSLAWTGSRKSAASDGRDGPGVEIETAGEEAAGGRREAGYAGK